MKIATDYIDGVVSGDILTNDIIRQVCRRHIDDMESQSDDTFPYYFDSDSATKAIKFVQLQKHAKGAMRGKPFDLQGWQAAPLWCVYGWKRKDNGLRRYRTAYIKVARKNGKTEYAAAIGNYGFFADNEKDPEVCWVATKKDQAKIGWQRQKLMIQELQRMSPYIRSLCTTAAHRVYTKEGDGFVSYLGRDSKTEDGHNPYYGIVDEYHAHLTDDMINVITSGMGGRMQPLLWIITTAGFNPNSPCAIFEKKCKQAALGQIDLDSVFPWVHDLDEEDDWEDESVWSKANPNLGVSVHLHNLREDYKKAKELGATHEVNFKTKNLNQWTTSGSTWIPDDQWLKNFEEIDIESLKGRECYGGLDLASVRDLCALCLFFPARQGVDEKHVVLFWHWVNEDQAADREKNDGVPYTQWAADRHIELTPGNITDHAYIESRMINLMEKYNIVSVAYDRKMSAHLIPSLADKGIRLEPFGQGFLSMSAPTKEFERLVYSEAINHLNNPVVRWQMSNVAIEMDAAGSIKISKNKSGEKVDGPVAMAMAIGEWMTERDDDSSVYNDRDMYIL